MHTDPLTPHPASRSYWQDRLAELELPSAREIPGALDYLIVGLGIAGAAIAHDLVRRGVAADRILIVDAAHAAFGASGRNAGFALSFPAGESWEWRQRYGDEGWLHLLDLNRRTREMVDATCQANPAVTTQRGGSHAIAASPEEAAFMAELHGLLRHHGYTDYLLHEGFPAVSPDYGVAVYQPADFGVHPVEYVAALMAESGVHHLPGTRVDLRGSRLEGEYASIHTSSGAIRARHIVLATNAFSPLLNECFRGRLRITAVRNQVILARIDGETTNTLWRDAVHYAREGWDYWRQFPDGTLLLGGGRDKDLEGETTNLLGENSTVLRYLEEQLLPVLAHGRRTHVERRWQGILGFTEDNLPFIGHLPDSNQRISFVAGFSGYGLGLHRAASQILVEMVTEGRPPQPFDVDRLSRGTLLSASPCPSLDHGKALRRPAERASYSGVPGEGGSAYRGSRR